jgi:hypothetical protein
MDETKRVVVVGSRGPLPAAVQTALKDDDWTIAAVRRGDDPLARSMGATAAVVLEGVSGDPALYQTALQAVAETLRESPTVKRVVALTPVRPRTRERDEARERFEAAEEEARRAGVPLVVLRYGLVVGMQRHRGPADGVLFAKRLGLVPTARRDEQQVRPLLTGDLARLVARAVTVEDPPAELEVEGPETFKLGDLLRRLGARRVWRFGPAWPPAVVLVSLALLAVPMTVVAASADPAWWAVAIAIAGVIGYPVGLVIAGRLSAAQRLLPDSDLLLRDAAPKRLLGVQLRGLSAEWGDDPAGKRAELRKRKKSLRRFRAQAASPAIALFLAVLGAAAIVVGGHDALFASAFGLRLTGALMAVVGVACAFGGVSLPFVGWAGRYVAAFVGGLAATAMLVVLLAVAMVNRDAPALAGVVAYLLLAAVGCCIALARRGATVVSRFVAMHWRKALSSIAAGGAILGLAQVLFTSVYLPTAGTPSVSMAATLEPAGMVGDRMALNATVQVKNSSQNTVNILGSYYTVRTTGLAAATPVPEATQLPESTRNAMQRRLYADQPVRGWAAERDHGVAERGGLTAPGWFLEPGEKIERHLVVVVPPDAHLATLHVSVALARRRFDVSTPFSATIDQRGGRRVVIQAAKIEDPSWIHRLTRSPRYIHTVSPFEASSLPDCAPNTILIAWIDGDEFTDDSTPCRAASTRLSSRFTDYYGLTWSETSAQAAVAPKALDVQRH